MTEQEAIKWYRLGVTPGWLEHTVKESMGGMNLEDDSGAVWFLVDRDIENQTGLFVGKPTAQRLADYWGIEQ